MNNNNEIQLQSGLYEQPINHRLQKHLDNLPDHYDIKKEKIDEAELPLILANLIQQETLKSLKRVTGTKRYLKQLELVNQLLNNMAEFTEDEDFKESQMCIKTKPESLSAVVNTSLFPGKKAGGIIRPGSSLTQSTLFTGSRIEPTLGSEIAKEIASANEIDILMSFIRWSGLRLIFDKLIDFTLSGGKLRIITTSYMGATEYKAIEKLAQLTNTEVKISYDTKRTRLHAKAYVFKRQTNFSTAYIGSSNISNSAMSAGLEWNTKITQSDYSGIYDQCCGRFETYWEDGDFVSFNPDDAEKTKMLQNALQSESKDHNNDTIQFNVNIQPYPYQTEIQEELNAERELRNNYRNLIVAATGTGKTMISAFDYKQFCQKNPNKKNRLMFIAHRQEILQQSLWAYRLVLGNNNFGELLTGTHNASEYDHLFITIQSFNSKAFIDIVKSDYYDFIVVDEFHHYAAPTYLKLLQYFNPKILLGLTATPERRDGKEKDIIKEYFNDCVSAEIRLPEAIHRRLLVPFQYFGVTDSLDYSQLKWTRGGYDRTELQKLILSDDRQRCNIILQSISKYILNPQMMRALGFCVSIKHAEYMAEFCNQHGLPADYLHSDCDSEKRNKIQGRLKRREINIIFVVDIYNEGVDIPFLDTVLFLRPTESLVVFLQQLGRGLRLYDKKECLTILDFVGHSHKNYSFEQRFRALLGTTNRSVEEEVKNEFPHVPAGCSILLEKEAQKHILNNIKKYFTSGGSKFVTRMKTFEEDSGKFLTLANFLDYYNLSIGSIYRIKLTWSELLHKAGKLPSFSEETNPDIKLLTTGLRRICHINSLKYIDYLLKNWENFTEIDYSSVPDEEQQYLRMFYYSIWQKPLSERNFKTLQDSFKQLQLNVHISNEIRELLRYNRTKIRFVECDIDLPYPFALKVHDRYSRDEIIASFMPKLLQQNHGYFGVGVIHFKDKKTDVFFVDLNKSEKDYSATTMYKDYALSSKLFHWQSQSNTPVSGNVGKRYINHQESGSHVLLFVRESKLDKNGITMPYHFLGKVKYRDHYGSKPINITWELHEEMPAYLVETSRRLG